MHLRVAFGFAAISGLACAKQLTFTNQQDAATCFALTTQFDAAGTAGGPEIRSLLSTLTPMLESLDKDIASLTPANSPTVSQSVNTKAHALAKALESSAKQLETSKPVGGISEVIFLISPAQKALTVANSTINHLLAKKDIIRASKELPIWVEGFTNLKPAVMAILPAALAQVPPTLLAQSPIPIPTGPQLSPIVDNMMDQLIGLFTGKQEVFTIPAAAIALIPGLQCENAPKPGSAPKGGKSVRRL